MIFILTLRVMETSDGIRESIAYLYLFYRIILYQWHEHFHGLDII